MDLTDSERIIIAKYIADDNLAHTNEISLPVKVKKSFYETYAKRFLDILFSGTALFVTLPINLVILVVTYFDVGFPIFFKSIRIGKDGKPFKLLKFRNMTNARDEDGNLLLPKYRVTRWGKFVRRTSLDELLNFWSIFKGDMSIIGPRPLVKNYVVRYSNRHFMRHAVRPGLECPYIMPKEMSGNHWQDLFENDVWYVENVSFLTDIKMIIRLIVMVFNRKETKMRGTAVRGGFMGYDEKGICVGSQDIPQKYIDKLHSKKK